MENRSIRLVNTGHSALAVKVRRADNSVDYVHIQQKSKVTLPQGYKPDHNFMVNNPSIKTVEPTEVVEVVTPTQAEV